jgi:hypothetical protein
MHNILFTFVYVNWGNFEQLGNFEHPIWKIMLLLVMPNVVILGGMLNVGGLELMFWIHRTKFYQILEF